MQKYEDIILFGIKKLKHRNKLLLLNFKVYTYIINNKVIILIFIFYFNNE